MYEVSCSTSRTSAEPHLAMKEDFPSPTDMLLDESRYQPELAYWNRGKSLFNLGGPIFILQPEFPGPLLLSWISRKVDNDGLTSTEFLDLIQIR